MKYILRLMILASLLGQIARADVQQDVDALVAQLPAFAGESQDRFMEIPEFGPVAKLLQLGMPAVPFLVPHLSNSEMTKSFRVHGSGLKRQISVNEFVGHIITRSCGHYFYIASGEAVVDHLGEEPITNPKTIAWYQEQVKKWHQHFGHWNESNRRLEDIEDWFHYNRFAAYTYFAKNPSPAAQQRLRARMLILLTGGERSSMTESELVSCSEAIAAAGDAADIALLKQVWTKQYEDPINTSGREDKVKSLYRSRVKLGDQPEAKKDLDAYNSRYAGKFPPISAD